MKDLVILAADKNAEYALRCLLGRPKALRIREVDADVFVHPERDPGCVNRGAQFLASLSKQYRFALLLFDLAGCGRESEGALALEQAAEASLVSAWGERSAAIVLDPELEVWVWSDSPHVDAALGWNEGALRPWLVRQGLLAAGAAKPADPKAAVEAALRHVRKPRSSAIYGAIASKVSVERCTDRALAKLRDRLATWFPERTDGAAGGHEGASVE